MEDKPMSEDRPEKLKIICKRMDGKGYDKFWKEVQEAFNDGYVYAKPENYKEMPRMHGQIVVTLQCKDYVTKQLATADKKAKELAEKQAEADKALEDAKKAEEESAKKKAELEETKTPSKEDPLEVIKGLKKRDELVGYAGKSLGIIVPDEITNVAAVRKHIKEAIEKQPEIKTLVDEVTPKEKPEEAALEDTPSVESEKTEPQE